MKAIIILALCFLVFPMQAQLFGNVSSKPDIYVYNKGKDTIYLTKINLGRWNYCGNVKVVDSVQIDGKGKKELVFFRDGSYIISEHGGTFDLDESKSVAKFEIWNLDTKTVLFEAVSMLKHHKNWFDARIQPSRDKIDEQYKYDFIVNASGNIIIDNFCGSKDAKPDQTVGRYQFINGKYTKT